MKVFSGDHDHLSVTPTLDSFLSHHSLESAPAGLVAENAHKHPFNPVHASDSLASIVPRLLEGVHRVPVTNADGAFIGVVSQSDIAKTLYQKRNEFPDFLSKSLPDLNLARKPVVTVDGQATVLDALMKLQKEAISSVAIVENDKMIMVLTMSDLKRMFKENKMADFKESCEAYKSSILRSRIFEKGHPEDTAPYFGVSPTANLLNVLGKMVATRAHRVYVVEDHKPVGIVTLTDFIGALTA